MRHPSIFIKIYTQSISAACFAVFKYIRRNQAKKALYFLFDMMYVHTNSTAHTRPHLVRSAWISLINDIGPQNNIGAVRVDDSDAVYISFCRGRSMAGALAEG